MIDLGNPPPIFAPTPPAIIRPHNRLVMPRGGIIQAPFVLPREAVRVTKKPLRVFVPAGRRMRLVFWLPAVGIMYLDFPAGDGVTFEVAEGGNGSSSSNASGYTFSSLSYGGSTPQSERVAIVAEGSRSGGNADPIEDCTVGGTTIGFSGNGDHVEDLSGGNSNNRRGSVLWGSQTSGTSGDVETDFNFATQLEESVQLFMVSILGSLTPSDSGAGSDDPFFDVPAGDSCFFAAKPNAGTDDPTISFGATSGTVIDTDVLSYLNSSAVYWENLGSDTSTGLSDNDGGTSQRFYAWVLLA